MHTITLLRSVPRTDFLPLAPRVAAPVARDLRVVAVVEAPEQVDGLRLPQAPDAGEGAVVQGQDRPAAAELLVRAPEEAPPQAELRERRARVLSALSDDGGEGRPEVYILGRNDK